MRTQKRWHCQECRREWVFRTTGPESNCPACGSPEIHIVEFNGHFDIDTPPNIVTMVAAEQELPVPTKRENEIVPPPLTLGVHWP